MAFVIPLSTRTALKCGFTDIVFIYDEYILISLISKADFVQFDCKYGLFHYKIQLIRNV